MNKNIQRNGTSHVGFVHLKDHVGIHGYGTITFMVTDQEGRAWIVGCVVIHD